MPLKNTRSIRIGGNPDNPYEEGGIAHRYYGGEILDGITLVPPTTNWEMVKLRKGVVAYTLTLEEARQLAEGLLWLLAQDTPGESSPAIRDYPH